MIKLVNITKKYDQRIVLNQLNLTLPQKGLVAIIGRSGAGKTTLLNILSGLENNYEGTYFFQKQTMPFTSKLLDAFRLLNIGYLFQDFRLFENETVLNNILLPLEVAAFETKENKVQLAKHLLETVSLFNYEKKEVKNLSGGEKQRVALVRALINRPKIILCDEPTGALDEENALRMMELLSKLAKHYLIVIVSHNENLVKQYCEDLYYLKEGKINLIKNSPKQSFNKLNFVYPLIKKKSNEFNLPFLIKLKRAFYLFKTRKTRLVFNNLIMSLGLFGFGLALLLTFSISSKIEESFASVIKPNMIVMSNKEEQPYQGQNYSARFKDLTFIKERYSSFVNYVGVCYQTPFESFFISRDELFISSTPYKIVLPRLTSRQVNDFYLLHELENQGEVFPTNYTTINNDEIIIGLNHNDMASLCYDLRIERNFRSLGNYIKAEKPRITFSIANENWLYDDEQVFHLVGVIETKESTLFHSNPLWSEYVFEERMRLPSIDHFNQNLPWEMTKTYYLKCFSDPSLFLERTLTDKTLHEFLFACATKKQFPTHFLFNNKQSVSRVLVYHLDFKGLNISVLPSLIKKEQGLERFYYTSEKGYYYHPNSFLVGFAQNVIVSISETKLDEVIDLDTFIDGTFSLLDNLPKGVVLGNLQTSLSDGLLFSSNLKNILYGRAPLNYDEVVISEGLMKKLFLSKEILLGDLHIGVNNDQVYYAKGEVEKFYSKHTLKIVGIAQGEQVALHHLNAWPIIYFHTKANIDPFLLIPRHVIFETKLKVKTEDIIKNLNDLYPYYLFTNPVEKINSSLTETMSLLNSSLFLFASLALLTSFFLFFIVIYVTIEENTKDIELYYYLGISQKEILSTFLVSSYVLSSLAFLIASIEIIFSDLMMNYFFKNYFMTNVKFMFDSRPIFIIFVLAFLIAFLATKFAFNYHLRKKNKRSM